MDTSRMIVRRLDGGGAITAIRMPREEKVAITVLVKAGPAHESPEERGASHLLEHLLWGTCTTPQGNVRGIVRKHIIPGGDFGPETWQEFTLYQAQVRPRGVNDVLWALSHVLAKPRINELGSEYDNEKRVVEAEISDLRDDTMRELREMVLKELWGDHPLARSISGTVEQVRQLTRENVGAYHARRYLQSNIVISIAGDIDHKVLDQIRSLPWGLSSAIQPSGYIASPNHCRLEQPQWKNFRCHNVYVWIGAAAPRWSWDTTYRLDCLSYLLSSDWLGKHLWDIRERLGLTYDISFGYELFQTGGLAAIEAVCSLENYEPLRKAVREKLVYIAEKGFTRSDVQVAKRLLRNSTDDNWQEPASMARFMAESVFYQPELIGRDIRKRELLGIIRAFESKSLKELASDLLQENGLSVVGLRPQQ